jgi:LacI family transcriptional regulator
MAQPFRDLGRTAMARLLAQLDGATGDGDSMLPVELVTRGSCGCPDPAGGEVSR